MQEVAQLEEMVSSGHPARQTPRATSRAKTRTISRTGTTNISLCWSLALTICLTITSTPISRIISNGKNGLVPVAGSPQAAASASAKPQDTNSASFSPVGCSYPAVNLNCQVNIIAQTPAVPLLNTDFVADEYSNLRQDTQAAYKCDHGYELLGSEQVTCLPSGRWSAPPPNCVTNIALGKPTNQSSTVRGGDSKNANDGKLITQHDSKYCTETKIDQSPWWQIDLLQVYDIRSVRILGRACCNPQLSLHDIEIRVGNSSLLQGNRLCAWYPNNLDEGTARDFQCAHPIVGRFVSIQMVGIETALSLCEVMVFSTKEFPAERCSIQSTLAPTGGNKPQSSAMVTTTTNASVAKQAGSQLSGTFDNSVQVFNRTCYETQATNGGSFLVADTYCKARGGSLLHSVNELTQAFISQELERMKTKLKSKLVWLGAKRESASSNALGPITPGSTSALIGVDNIHHPLISDRSLSASLHEFPIENLFSTDHGLISAGESSSIFNPALKLSRSSLLQTSTGAGGSTSRGSQTFGLQTSGQHHNHHATNRSGEHPGRSLIISQPSQVASYFAPPVPISNPPVTQSSPTIISAPQPVPSPSPIISFTPSASHAHRSLRPPSLVSQQSTNPASSSWNPSKLDSANTLASSASSQSQSTSSSWRWVGDAASDTILSPITSFLWAEDQPNNYNSQQDCIVMDGGKKWLWNDVTCELDYLPWVCQYRPSTCGSPDHYENSTILEILSPVDDGAGDRSFQFGKVVTYACPIGHRIDGSRTRKCLYDGTWSGRAPKCQYVNCGPVSSQTIENGRVIYLNQSQTTYGSQVKYVCYEDYVLVGDDTRQCQSDGKWGGKQPYCAYKWCPVLQPISNGVLNVTGYNENSIATYQCNSGYKLIGNDTRQCLLGGKWTNQEPFCQYVDCGKPKQLQNGNLELLNGTTNYLSVVSYTCNENYTLVSGSNKLVCSHNNRWTGREPQCSLIDCGQPQVSLGSRFTGDSFTVHSTIDYKCDPGFKEVSGNTQRTCGLDGQWTGQPLVCKYVDCGRVPAILKGEVSYINGTTYLASQVLYECTSGNRISGHRVRFCGPDGRWTGTSPKCEEVRCDAPELPANGSAIYIGNDRSFKEQSFSVGVTVQYECDYGHVVMGSWATRLCQASGDWSGEPPICKFVDCGQPPSIENGNYILKHPPGGLSSGAIGSATPVELSRRSDSVGSGAGAVGTFTYYGTIAHYTCDSNYKLIGPAQRECLETGRWRTPTPTCEPIQCPKPEFFDEYTQVSLIPVKSSQNSDVSVQPLGDTQLSSQLLAKSIKLIANNQWISDDSSNLSFGVGDRLHYSCIPGYESYGGPEIRTCTQYGQWSGSSTPRCRLIDCGRPAPIGQEGRYYLLNETTTFNSLVEYSCVRPFKLIEVKLRQAGNLIETLSNAQAGVTQILTSLPIGVKVCANNGQWMPNDQQPKCTTGGMPVDGTNSNGQHDGVDNTLDGSNRVQILSGSGMSSNNQHHSTFIGANSNQDSDSSSLDLANGQHHTRHHQRTPNSQSASIWAKIVIAICLLVMLGLIILTLICIRSGKKPKQLAHRASMLASGGHQAAAAAASMQFQLANGKGLGQQQVAASPPSHLLNHHSVSMGQTSMMPGQNIYLNGMQKMFSGSMVGHSQMSSGVAAHMVSYGDASPAALMGNSSQNGSNASRTIVGVNSQGEIVMNGKSNSLGVVGHHGRSTTDGIDRHLPASVSSSSVVDSYSRLSIDSDHIPNINGTQSVGNKTIRHNPNGLVTFVSPAQQPSHHQNNQNKMSGQPPVSSSSSGVSSTSHHQNNQISPHSISSSLSVSASSSPSSSSSAAHNTTATRLSASDSTGSPSSINHSQHHNRHSQLNGVNRDQLNQSQHNEYQAPQQFLHQGTPPQSSPPSLPAHPPPPHRVQLQHKQLMKHQSNPSRQRQQQEARPSEQSNTQKHQLNNNSQDDNHYMDPSI